MVTRGSTIIGIVVIVFELMGSCTKKSEPPAPTDAPVITITLAIDDQFTMTFVTSRATTASRG
jgi:hypothetical protein